MTLLSISSLPVHSLGDTLCSRHSATIPWDKNRMQGMSRDRAIALQAPPGWTHSGDQHLPQTSHQFSTGGTRSRCTAALSASPADCTCCHPGRRCRCSHTWLAAAACPRHSSWSTGKERHQVNTFCHSIMGWEPIYFFHPTCRQDCEETAKNLRKNNLYFK